MKNPGQLMGVLATFAIGCSDSGPSPSAGFTERDSLGIIIVDNKAPRWTEKTRWRLDEEPLVDIGRAEGEAPYLLDRVRQALRLRDGRIAVLSYGLNEIRIFDAAGRYLRTLGRTHMVDCDALSAMTARCGRSLNRISPAIWIRSTHRSNVAMRRRK